MTEPSEQGDSSRNDALVSNRETVEEAGAGRKGPGWGLTIASALFSLLLGFGGGMLVDGSVELINAYKIRANAAEGPPSQTLEQITADPIPLSPPKNQTAWYPDNNQIEWFISLRPGIRTVPVEIENEHPNENRKIVFQYLSNRAAPRPAAEIYIRAGETARINLPVASYRLDLASTPPGMPWEIAKKQPALPTFTIPLDNSSRDLLARKLLYIGVSGSVRLAEPLSGLTQGDKPSKSPSPPSPEPTDYDAIGVDEEPSPEPDTEI